MATKKETELNAELRERFLAMISEMLVGAGEEVLRVESGAIAMPVVDSEGNDKYLKVQFVVPTGSRDGEAYDAYSMAEAYTISQREKAEAKAKTEAKKKAQIAKDEARRKAQAEAKAKREAHANGNAENEGE